MPEGHIGLETNQPANHAFMPNEFRLWKSNSGILSAETQGFTV